MRRLGAAALSAALALTSAASAQGIGDVAARERDKRKAAAAKPAKVYNEDDIARSLAPVSLATPGRAPAAQGAVAAEGTPGDAEDTEQVARAKAEADWRKRLDQAHQHAAVYRSTIDGLQLILNDITGGVYNAGRASKIAFLEENKQLLAETQARIAALEDEGRREGYR